MGFDLIVTVFLLLSQCSFFVFGGGVSFFFDGPLADGCSTASCNFGALAGDVEKAVAPHSSTLAWKIPWTEEPGRLQSMGS